MSNNQEKKLLNIDNFIKTNNQNKINQNKKAKIDKLTFNILNNIIYE